MPQVDYMILADYVRQDGGVTHIMGAGIDTITVGAVPAGQAAGVVVRLTFDTMEPVGEPHQIKLIFQGPDNRLLEVGGSFMTPPQVPGLPPHWRTAVSLAFRLTLPLPQYGDYSLELDIDDGQITKSLDVRVVPLVSPGS